MDTYQYIETLPTWARRRPIRRKNFLSQLHHALFTTRAFPPVYVDEAGIQTA